MLTDLTAKLHQAAHLTPEQIREAVQSLIDEQIAPEEKADFLCALAAKGETTEEIAAFAMELRQHAVTPQLHASTRSREVLDVCGTGGDHLNTFNISSSVAILVCAGGVTVAKHGNRAITSQCGSADVLETLGIPVALSPEQASRSLQEHQFAFFFAPHYHPAFKHIAPARKICAERGRRTIFNFLGPLLNPARPTAQLIGVPRPELCQPLAEVLQAMGLRRAMVVCGHLPETEAGPEGAPRYLDELSTLGPTTIAEFYHGRGFHTSTLSAMDLPVRRASLPDLAGGGDRQAGAQLVEQILDGRDHGPKRDAVLLNAGAAFFVAGAAASIAQGWDKAAEIIDSGAARRKLEELRNADR